LHDPVVASVLREPQRTAPEIVGGKHLALGHLASRLILLNLSRRRFEAIRRMAQEDHPQDRHKVVTGGELGVGPEVVRRFPEVGFEIFDIVEGFVDHTAPR
jgi:hypothetical protein